MPESSGRWSDEQVERYVGRLLQLGVSLAAVVVVAGGILFLYRHGSSIADHHQFRGEPPQLRRFWWILTDAGEFHSRGIIQLGLLLLIATPVARVALLAIAFMKQRDVVYIVITLFVLAILAYSLFFGHA